MIFNYPYHLVGRDSSNRPISGLYVFYMINNDIYFLLKIGG